VIEGFAYHGTVALYFKQNGATVRFLFVKLAMAGLWLGGGGLRPAALECVLSLKNTS
jgi:hypothetical protein